MVDWMESVRGIIYPLPYSIVTSILRERENYYTPDAIKPLALQKNEIFLSYWDASNFHGASSRRRFVFVQRAHCFSRCAR